MRKSARGGSRTGSPGQAYTNRSDLSAAPNPVAAASGPTGPPPNPTQAPAQPPTQGASTVVPTGLGYGQHQALQAQAAQMPAPDVPALDAQTAHAAAAAYPWSEPPPLDRATERPNEPVTAGVASGPGPGPSGFGTTIPNPLVQGAAILNTVGQSSPSLDALKALVNASLANQAAV